MPRMHTYDDETEELARAIVAYARARIATPVPLDGPAPAEELARRAGVTVTPEGVGGEEALRVWAEILAPSTISTDHPAFLAFVPGAPTKASVLFDLVISASSTYGGSWLEGTGAVWAENEALRWIVDLTGLPASSGGVFVSGGTAGNLSALGAARHAASTVRSGRPARWTIAAGDTAHSSVISAAHVMDADILSVPSDERGRLTGAALGEALDIADTDGLFAVVASAGSTNAGTVDDLAGVADVCAERGLWLHVDGAYGGAGLFAPFDACALLYRDTAIARAAHVQEASYLDSLNATAEWNASDYAFHLTRRARGLPLWFSLATYGTDAYRDAIESVLTLTRAAADEIRAHAELELILEPDLSVLLFRRTGWSSDDYEAWWRRLLDAQVAFVQPTSWEGERVARLCFVNPSTTIEHVRAILGTKIGRAHV